MRIVIAVIISTIVGLAIGYFFGYDHGWEGSLAAHEAEELEHADDVHVHAGFKLFVGGELQDFSDFKYMNFETCSEDGEEEDHGDDPLANVHLHDYHGDIVHVHKAGIVWGQLFESLGVDVSHEVIAGATVDGVPVETILDKDIRDLESVVIIVGPEPRDLSQLEPVRRERILEVAKSSETCGS